MRPKRPHLIAAAFLIIGMMTAAVSFTRADEAGTPVAGTAAEVVREVLSATEPEVAPGQAFELVRYTIPEQVTLPPHTHPGIQMNYVVAGTLTYYVVADGTIAVTRADGTEETFAAGAVVTFAAGDSFIEPAGIVHYGANLTDEPVVILTAALLDADEPPSTIVDVATPANED